MISFDDKYRSCYIEIMFTFSKDADIKLSSGKIVIHKTTVSKQSAFCL